MNPLLTLLLGAATGATLVKLAQKSNSKAYMKQAKHKLYEATASGLESLEHSSAKLRHKLEDAEPTAPKQHIEEASQDDKQPQ